MDASHDGLSIQRPYYQLGASYFFGIRDYNYFIRIFLILSYFAFNKEIRKENFSINSLEPEKFTGMLIVVIHQIN